MAAYEAYAEALEKAVVLKGMNRFQPHYTATTVRITNGKSEVLNGPYATRHPLPVTTRLPSSAPCRRGSTLRS